MIAARASHVVLVLSVFLTSNPTAYHYRKAVFNNPVAFFVGMAAGRSAFGIDRSHDFAY
jgi:hypothetical protein